MTRKLVTCPETAHLEQIDYEADPLGILIVRCSRYDTGCAPDCPRTCAARMDRHRAQTKLGADEDTAIVRRPK